MELRTDEKIFLDFDYAQVQMQLDRLGYLCLGVIMIAVAFGIAVVKIRPERMHK
ncbi:MAG: hypothetical protein IJZ35_01935 [Clostridia bacterium]|nr:hypothetical protein [Clostridia bacterium]